MVYSSNITHAQVSGAIKAVVLAASRDETVPVLNMVKVTIKGDRVILIATDRYRAARVTMGPFTNEDGDDTFTITRADAMRLAGYKSGRKNGFVVLSIRENVMAIGDGGPSEVIVPIIRDAQYPQIERIWPDRFSDDREKDIFNPGWLEDMGKFGRLLKADQVALRFSPLGTAQVDTEDGQVQGSMILMPRGTAGVNYPGPRA